jgi:class 3 adenylate cyclase
MIAKTKFEPKVIRTVGQLTFLFTDLHDSTALYQQVGDVAACRIVRQHFTLLAGVVRDHDGAVVKTIGDAVMAAFANPLDAVKAALAIQAHVARASPPLTIKLGVHAGASVKVKLCNQVDYFGSAVNMAARLRAQSLDGDVVLSQAVAEHPAVRPLLASTPTLAGCVTMKGFEGPVGFVRILPRGPDPPEDHSPAPPRVGASVRAYQYCLALGGQ